MESNFSFIKECLPKTYCHLEKAERTVRHDIELKMIRQALESFVDEIAEMSNAVFLFKKFFRGRTNGRRFLTLCLRSLQRLNDMIKLRLELFYLFPGVIFRVRASFAFVTILWYNLRQKIVFS